LRAERVHAFGKANLNFFNAAHVTLRREPINKKGACRLRAANNNGNKRKRL
jgi:hypothetical protein